MSGLPSDAQARRLAELWGTNRSVHIGGYADPTISVLLKRGWLTPQGVFGTYPNGTQFEKHHISPSGVGALAAYFIRKAGIR